MNKIITIAIIVTSFIVYNCSNNINPTNPSVLSFSLEGIVVDKENDTPIKDVTIYINENIMTTTDSVGYFKIEDLEKGEYLLSISKTNYDSLSQKIDVNSNTKLLLSLGKVSFFIEGIVVDKENDIPIKDVIININEDIRTTTDAAGYFKIDGLEKGEYLLLISKTNYDSLSQKISVNSNTKLSFSLEKLSFFIEGVVVDKENDIPIKDVTIYIDENIMTTTDSVGYFKIEDLEKGEYSFLISKAYYNSLSQKINVNSNTKLSFSLEKMYDDYFPTPISYNFSYFHHTWIDSDGIEIVGSGIAIWETESVVVNNGMNTFNVIETLTYVDTIYDKWAHDTTISNRSYEKQFKIIEDITNNTITIEGKTYMYLGFPKYFLKDEDDLIWISSPTVQLERNNGIKYLDWVEGGNSHYYYKYIRK